MDVLHAVWIHFFPFFFRELVFLPDFDFFPELVFFVYAYFLRPFLEKAFRPLEEARRDTILPCLFTMRSFFVSPPFVCWARPSYTWRRCPARVEAVGNLGGEVGIVVVVI